MTDEYTAVKQRGALAHWGQQATVPISAAQSDGIPNLRELWAERDGVRAEADRRRPGHLAEFGGWWDAVADALA